MPRSLSDNVKKEILAILPDRLGAAIEPETLDAAEEIRIRAGWPMQVIGPDGERLYPIAGYDDCEAVFSAAHRHSLYACEEELRHAFVTLPGGGRVGFCGKALIGDDGSFRRVGNISSINIRIPRQCFGAADAVMPYVLSGGHLNSVLITAPPRGGKTTLLRDIARQLSYSPLAIKICIIDERSELAGGYCGIPQNDMGPRCDVLDGCPKTEGFMLALRAMSPDVILTDEIGADEDADAIAEASLCGVRVIASAHGATARQVIKRPCIRRLVENGDFRYIIAIRRVGGNVGIEEVRELEPC